MLDIFVFSGKDCGRIAGGYSFFCARMVEATTNIETSLVIAIYVALIIFATALRVVTYWIIELYSGRIVTDVLIADLSQEMTELAQGVERTLYAESLTKHTAHANQLMNFIRAGLSILPASAFIIISTIGVLTVIGGVASVLAVIFAVLYLGILAGFRNFVSRIAMRLKDQSDKVVSFISDVLSDLRSNIVFGREQAVISQYINSDSQIRRDVAVANTLSIAPRYLLEGLLVALGILFVILSTSGPGRSDVGVATADYGSAATIFLLSLRLVPTAQQLYSAVLNIQVSAEVVSCYRCFQAEPVIKSASNRFPLNNEAVTRSFSVLKCDAIRLWSPLQRNGSIVSFSAKRSELIVIKGESGVGKTSFLDQLMGFKPHESGNISFVLDNGQAISPAAAVSRQLIALVTQNPYVASDDSQNGFFQEVDQSRIDATRAWVERLRLESLVEFSQTNEPKLIRSSGLSGGEKQRLALLRALIARRDIVVLDEPISALDDELRKTVVLAIREMMHTSLVIAVMHGDDLDNIASHILTLSLDKAVA